MTLCATITLAFISVATQLNSQELCMKRRKRLNSEKKIWRWDPYSHLACLNSWPFENEGFSFISERYTIKSKETIYETGIQIEPWNINMYISSGSSNWHILKIDLTKMRVLTLFQFDTKITDLQTSETVWT